MESRPSESITSEKLKEMAAILDLSDPNQASSIQTSKKESLPDENNQCGNQKQKIEPPQTTDKVEEEKKAPLPLEEVPGDDDEDDDWMHEMSPRFLSSMIAETNQKEKEVLKGDQHNFESQFFANSLF